MCETTPTEGQEEAQKKKPNRKRKPFVRPTIEEMKAYFKEQNLNGDPEACWWYYESCGWVVGDKPMKSWKGSCQTWSRNEKTYRPKNKYGKKDTMEYYDTSEYDNLPF